MHAEVVTEEEAVGLPSLPNDTKLMMSKQANVHFYFQHIFNNEILPF